MNSTIKGGIGEARVAEFLKKKKYEILEMNFSVQGGEIDIVAKQKDTIVFVEVKSRLTATYGLPREAVTKTKQQHIVRTATAYLQRKKLFGSPVRFDVAEVWEGNIVHIENAFEA